MPCGPTTPHVDGRTNALWGTLLAGGLGNEWHFGYQHAHSDLTRNDSRSRDAWWNFCRYALEFFADHAIPVRALRAHRGGQLRFLG